MPLAGNIVNFPLISRYHKIVENAYKNRRRNGGSIMLTAQTKFITLDNGYHVWTRRVGNSDQKLLLVHSSSEMPWEYLAAFTKLERQHHIEIIFMEMVGSYLSDQPEGSAFLTDEAQMSAIEQVRKAYNLRNFKIHGIAIASFQTNEYAQQSAYASGLLSTQHEFVQARATEILEGYDNPEYQKLILNGMTTVQTI